MLRHEIRILPKLFGEMKPWQTNTPLRSEVWAAARNESRSVKVLLQPQVEQISAFDHYFSLLTYRKRVGESVVESLRSELEHEPTPTEYIPVLQRRFGDRGLRLARKGWEERDRETRFADEELVTAAMLTSIVDQRETVIVTFDNDVLDQFAKLAFMIAEDYKAYLVAQKFQEMPFACPRCYFPSGSREAVSGVIGLKLRPIDVWDLVPNVATTNTYCILLGNDFRDLQISEARMNFPLDAGALLDVKHRCGANTQELGGRNCRVYPDVTSRQSPIITAIIGYDAKVRFMTRIFRVEDLRAAIREEDQVMFLGVEGVHEANDLPRHRELVMPIGFEGGDEDNEANREWAQRRRRVRERESDRGYCQPLVTEEFLGGG